MMFDLEQNLNQMMHQYKLGADQRIEKKSKDLNTFNKHIQDNNKKVDDMRSFVSDQLGPINETMKKMQSQITHLSKENAMLKTKPVVSPAQMWDELEVISNQSYSWCQAIDDRLEEIEKMNLNEKFKTVNSWIDEQATQYESLV